MEQPHSIPDPAHPPAQAIHHELRTATNSAAFLLPRLSALKAHNPHLKLLDLGAGSGSISTTLAQTLPDGHVTGIDIKPDILPRARAVAELAGVTNIDFQQGDARQLAFEDGSFDVVFCHQMLTHVSAPWEVLREMLRVAKAGGIVAAREGDLETECVWPEMPGLVKFHRFAADVMSAAGGTATAGRQLLGWALRAGARRSQVEVSYSSWAYCTTSDRETWGGF